jgi:hypothetical protein
MSLHSNMQICGDTPVEVKRHHGEIWVTVRDGNQSITMNARHVLALADALAAFEADEKVSA